MRHLLSIVVLLLSGTTAQADFIKQCKNPQETIRVTCKSREIREVFVGVFEKKLPVVRTVVVSGAGKEFVTPALEFSESGGEKVVICSRYKEFETILTHEQDLSCEEALGLEMTIDEYCSAQLAIQREAHPELVVEKDTGKLIEVCPK